MLPTSQPTAQKPFPGRRDDATLYASLELSQATWLVTSLSPGGEKMSKYSTPGGDSAALLGLLRRLQVKAEQIAGGPVNIMVIQEAGLTASGCTDCWKQTVSRATWSTPRRSPCHGVGGERRPMRSTARRC